MGNRRRYSACDRILVHSTADKQSTTEPFRHGFKIDVHDLRPKREIRQPQLSTDDQFHAKISSRNVLHRYKRFVSTRILVYKTIGDTSSERDHSQEEREHTGGV